MAMKIAFFAYSVRDVAKAHTFYRDVVGLVEGDAVSEHWVEFDVDGTAFGIGNGERIGMEPGTSFGLSFEVEDVGAERERLAKAGVDIGEVMESPVCFHAFAQDPEGNKFAIHKRK